ncbi:MBL fold metallo-hydrolase [Poritiphilus flavus]|uniref:MBL fold metallo-hydrolase n=1 Tax=Poritiphilus flavus TaxID=2697053 RepID=A0A6L9ED39_9FLAO|nr:MBL fold metallo-hydrolase [Poritiphilus flavus]NAS12533.1 MBL fold metallo-hydrolase [Poritiphilus flavus]
MKIKFFGTRGSIPVCEQGYQEFGGNTSCVAVFGESDSDVLVFDAGTGIRNLGKELMQQEFLPGRKIVIAFSHFHWDHIQGLPFFAPAYDPSKEIHVIALGNDLNIQDFKAIFAKQMESTYFPVALDNMGANFSFIPKKSNEQIFPDGIIKTHRHRHPGGAHSYRLEARGKVMVYCTDIEHGSNIEPSIVDFTKGADVLIHDAQYTPEELPNFRGWGHSSWEQAIEVAERAHVKTLFLTHHDPEHDDTFLHKVENECQKRFPNCYLAREGMEFSL